MINLTQAKQLKYGDMIHHTTLKNADKTPMRFTVKGEVDIWKRDVDRIRVPLKHGLYEYGYLVNGTFEGNGKGFNVDIKDVNLGDGD